MSPEASLYLSLLLCAIILNVECASSIPDHCLELIKFDVDEIESHLSGLNLTDVPTVKMMTAGFKCPISTLPFGTLKSDWARLLLLREAQPDGSIVKLKLLRLIRILIIAYYQMEERIDVMDPEAKAAMKSLAGETTTTVSSTARETSQPHCPSSNNSLGAEISCGNANRHCSRTDSFPNGVTATKDGCSRMKSNATVIEIGAMKKNVSGPSGTTTVIPSDATRQNVTSSLSIDPGNAKKATFNILGNCLKQSLKDFVRRRPSGRRVFENVRDKAKYGELVGNEIDGRGGDGTLIRITPPTNEFWRYVTFPTRAPLIVPVSVRPAYRMRGLSGTAGPRKSRKRVKLNNDIYESFRRFYDAGRNKEGIK
ncbi:uncharacterized protein LOC105831089 isoform X2 [Monomorium pharaonis]|uniref:uncharacterized protein LOC105831089 isoform X2 n=1 Tax=Monomorium pharaonis TaxID=307658 RepID=UPI0017460CAD|nr:uncharacterized protein LOC105831089 isoform X2 [Monomorium pharaonis]